MKNSTVYFAFLLLAISSCKKDDKNNIPFNAPKEILVAGNTPAGGQLLIMDYNGNTIKQKDLGSASIFQRWVFNGQIRYSYLETDASGALPGVGYIPGTVVILDTALNEVKRLRLLPYQDHDPLKDALDSHEFILINDDHYIAQAYYEKVVSNIPASLNPASGCKVIVPIIQEVQGGKVIWEWDASDHPEFYDISVEGNQFSNATINHDYIHLNSMFIDPRDNNLICSFRNLDQVVKLNRITGKVMWKLGGKNSDFPLTADQKFIRQHHATLTDNNQTLLIYDNGDYNLRPATRVVEFKLDEINKTVTGFKSFPVPYFGQFRGSVQKTDSSYFIGSGGTRFYEINYNTGQISINKILPYISYRALRY